MTDRTYTDADLHHEAARQLAGRPDHLDSDRVGQEMCGAEIASLLPPAEADGAEGAHWEDVLNANGFDEAERAVHGLITGAADTSRWAVDLGADGLETSDYEVTLGNAAGPFVRLHLAFHPSMPEHDRRRFHTGLKHDITNALQLPNACPGRVNEPDDPQQEHAVTNPDLRHIAVILDRSGSMQAVKTDTEGGLAAFLEAQREAPGLTTVSLYQFDDQYEAVYERTPLTDVPPFTLWPRGSTALLDAVGRTITTLAEHVDGLPEADRPGEVTVVILTDGQENASHEYSKSAVKKLIDQQQSDHGWQFVFLGADQDAFQAAGGIGIRAESTLSYGSEHTQQSMTNAGRMVARGTRTGVYAFSDEEREETS